MSFVCVCVCAGVCVRARAGRQVGLFTDTMAVLLLLTTEQLKQAFACWSYYVTLDDLSTVAMYAVE